METLSTTASARCDIEAAMRLGVEMGERVADKIVPKMMRGAGVDCGIRRGADCHRCKSCRGVAGETFGNAVGRGFGPGGPRGKMGADAAEPRQL